jgi:SulP family sulfate permease
MTSGVPALRRASSHTTDPGALQSLNTPSGMFDTVWPDIVAGLTVAVMGVPQAMAYALIAGLPPVHGLYVAIIPCMVAAFLGSSHHLVTGPTNATCMVILSLTAGLPARYGVGLLEVVVALTILTGVFQIVFACLKLGGVVRYLSNSVVIGLTAGAGILIAANQLKNLLGVNIDASQGAHFFPVIWATAMHLGEVNPYALSTGVLTIVVVIFCKRRWPRVPGSIIGLTVATGLALAAGWTATSMGDWRVWIVRDIQEIRPSLDIFGVPELLLRPNLPLLGELCGGALALAVLGFVESTSSARSVAAATGQRLDFNRQFRAQGIANIVGSFFHCFVASGSFTRTAVCHQSGGRTRMAAMFSAIFTLVIFMTLGPLANFIPQSSLAAILMVIAFGMLEKKRLAMTWRSGANSRIVLSGTLAATLLLPLETAVFAGVLLSVLILLRITGKPDLTQLVPHPDYGFEEVPFNRAPPAPVVIINLEGDLYFAATDDLDYELLLALKPQTRVVVLRMKRLRAVGSSAMAMLEHFHHLLQARGIQLIVCGIEDDLKKVLTGSGVRQMLGERNIFYADNRIFQSTELALARARLLVDLRRTKEITTAIDSPPGSPLATTASSLMRKRCLRFGSQHQVREAMWLISQFQHRMDTIHPQTVFLQDREGRLVAELSLRSILRDLAATVPSHEAAAMNDVTLGGCLQSRLYQKIGSIARSGPFTLKHDATLDEILAIAGQGFRPMPVADAHGRIAGVFDEMSMLRAIYQISRSQRSAAISIPMDPMEKTLRPGNRHDARFVRLRDDQTLSEALDALFDPATSTGHERVIAAVDRSGSFVGLLDPGDLIDAILSYCSPGTATGGTRMTAIHDALRQPLADRVRRDLPAVSASASLACLLMAAASNRATMLPVITNNGFTDVIAITRIFDKVCKTSLATVSEEMPFLTHVGERQPV